MSAPRVPPLIGVTASALRASAHLPRTPTPDRRANERLINQSAPHRAERPDNEADRRYALGTVMKPANSSGWERFATSPNSLKGPHAAVLSIPICCGA